MQGGRGAKRRPEYACPRFGGRVRKMAIRIPGSREEWQPYQRPSRRRG